MDKTKFQELKQRIEEDARELAALLGEDGHGVKWLREACQELNVLEEEINNQ